MSPNSWPGDPWPWLLSAAGLLGAGAGFLLRALGRRLGGRVSRQASPSTGGMILLALGVLAAAGLLVFPDKTQLLASRPYVPALLLLGLGLLAGLLPRALGLPLLGLGAAFSALLLLALQDWLPLGGPRRVAVLTPFEVGPSSWSGELRIEERDGLPLLQRVSAPGSKAGLVVERLELEGPLALIGGGAFYRLSGLSRPAEGEGGPLFIEVLGPAPRLADLLLPLGAEAGAARSLPFARRWREASEPRALSPLGVCRFRLDPGAPRGSELRLED